MTTTPIYDVLGWIFYGAVRYVLLWIPLLTPFRVERNIPWQWFRYGDYYDWFHYNDNNGGPDEYWLQKWFQMVVGEFKLLVLEEAKPYVDVAWDALRSLIGGLRPGFSSVGQWVDWLQRVVGYVVPNWAGDLGRGLEWLYERFPSGIRVGWQSWSDIWEDIKSSVRSWARDRYDRAASWASQNLGWIGNVGESLAWWRGRVAGWIDYVRSDPRGWIVGFLGYGIDWLLEFARAPVSIVRGWLDPDWTRLTTFAQDCLSFYYNLWSAGWATLGGFVDDPKGFLMDRLERAIMDRW